MGLSNFPSSAEGVLPVLVTHTVISVAILKNLLLSILQLMGAVNWVSTNIEENSPTDEIIQPNSPYELRRMRGVIVTQFKYMCNSCRSGNSKIALEGRKTVECCVCLCRFEDEEMVSELSCKHFFHRSCLDKWFDNLHSTCPLCRSIY